MKRLYNDSRPHHQRIKPCRTAIEAYVQERHETNIDNYEAFQPTAERARQRVGRLVGAAPERVAFVQFLSGFRADLEAIGGLCAERGVLFCVDAIQGLGALRLDVDACGVDFLACGAQKWLMATQGLAFFYVRASLQEQLTPRAGWLHGPVDWENFFDYELAFHPEARRFEVGTMNNLGLAALDAALGLHFEAGPAWCEAQVLARAQQLSDGLRALGLPRYGTDAAAHASGIVTVRPPQAEALFAHLKAQGITAALRNRMLRFAPTYYNTPEEIETVLEAVASFEAVGAV